MFYLLLGVCCLFKQKSYLNTSSEMLEHPTQNQKIKLKLRENAQLLNCELMKLLTSLGM